MLNSASAVADGIMSELLTRSASSFATGASGNLTKNDFGLLDTTQSGSVFVLLPGGFVSDFHAHGGARPGQRITYTTTVRVFVRDFGNSQETLNRVWQAERDLAAPIDVNNDLSGSVLATSVARGGGWDGYQFVEVGGQVWAPQDFYIETLVTTR